MVGASNRSRYSEYREGDNDGRLSSLENSAILFVFVGRPCAFFACRSCCECVVVRIVVPLHHKLKRKHHALLECLLFETCGVDIAKLCVALLNLIVPCVRMRHHCVRERRVCSCYRFYTRLLWSGYEVWKDSLKLVDFLVHTSSVAVWVFFHFEVNY